MTQTLFLYDLPFLPPLFRKVHTRGFPDHPKSIALLPPVHLCFHLLTQISHEDLQTATASILVLTVPWNVWDLGVKAPSESRGEPAYRKS